MTEKCSICHQEKIIEIKKRFPIPPFKFYYCKECLEKYWKGVAQKANTMSKTGMSKEQIHAKIMDELK